MALVDTSPLTIAVDRSLFGPQGRRWIERRLPDVVINICFILVSGFGVCLLMMDVCADFRAHGLGGGLLSLPKHVANALVLHLLARLLRWHVSRSVQRSFHMSPEEHPSGPLSRFRAGRVSGGAWGPWAKITRREKQQPDTKKGSKDFAHSSSEGSDGGTGAGTGSRLTRKGSTNSQGSQNKSRANSFGPMIKVPSSPTSRGSSRVPPTPASPTASRTHSPSRDYEQSDNDDAAARLIQKAVGDQDEGIISSGMDADDLDKRSSFRRMRDKLSTSKRRPRQGSSVDGYKRSSHFVTEDDAHILFESPFFIKMVDDDSWLWVEDEHHIPQEIAGFGWAVGLFQRGYRIGVRYPGEVRRHEAHRMLFQCEPGRHPGHVHIRSRGTNTILFMLWRSGTLVAWDREVMGGDWEDFEILWLQHAEEVGRCIVRYRPNKGFLQWTGTRFIHTKNRDSATRLMFQSLE
jgi:hypothetical protein